MIRGLLAMRFTQRGDVRTSARVTVHTFKHICSLPLVHRLKGVLLVYYRCRGVIHGTPDKLIGLYCADFLTVTEETCRMLDIVNTAIRTQQYEDNAFNVISQIE